ncbi:hypothetical protein LCGC14_1439080 [marine sediment metagenome]|uniref:Calcineurin-like phosphoesterase domain-containing protein n=1 Tax=marine sediment metagenome TaxID=412755 RepID=A0A0F9K7F1_9ZZZZ
MSWHSYGKCGLIVLAVAGLLVALSTGADRPVPATKPSATRPARSRPAGATLAVLTDVHVDRKPNYRFGRGKPNPAFRQAIGQINALRPAPREVIILGDLARAGREEDYRKYLEALETLKVRPVRHLLGNHDKYPAFRKIVLKRQARAAPATQPAPKHRFAWNFGDDWRCIALDSRGKRTRGLVTPRQIKWLENQARGAAGKNVLVFMHHHPARKGMTGISDSQQFLAAIDRHPNIRAIFFGHRHEMEFKQHAGRVHLIGVPATSWIFKARRARGWMLLTPGKKSLKVEFVPLSAKEPKQGFIKDLTWK